MIFFSPPVTVNPQCLDTVHYVSLQVAGMEVDSRVRTQESWTCFQRWRWILV